MPQSKTHFYYHFVWTTWRRSQMVTSDVERRIYRSIENEVRKLRGTVLALDGMPDHVHLAVQLPGTVAPSQLMQRVKGVSSTLGREVLIPGGLFGWQDGYAGFTIIGQHLQNTIAYIRNQKRHHAEGTTIPEWESPDVDEDQHQRSD